MNGIYCKDGDLPPLLLRSHHLLTAALNLSRSRQPPVELACKTYNFVKKTKAKQRIFLLLAFYFSTNHYTNLWFPGTSIYFFLMLFWFSETNSSIILIKILFSSFSLNLLAYFCSSLCIKVMFLQLLFPSFPGLRALRKRGSNGHNPTGAQDPHHNLPTCSSPWMSGKINPCF